MNVYLAKLEEKCFELIEEEKWQRALEISIQVVKIKTEKENPSTALHFISEFLSKVSFLIINLILSERIKQVKQMVKSIDEAFPSSPQVSNLLSKISVALHRSERPKLAKSYILKGLRAPGTYKGALLLNLSAILNTENSFKEALKYALEASKVLKEDLKHLQFIDSSDRQQKITELAIAYHNIAVIEESIGNANKAMHWYRKSHTFVQKYGINLSDLDKFILRNMSRARLSRDSSVGRTTSNSYYKSAECMRVSSSSSAIQRRISHSRHQSSQFDNKQKSIPALPNVKLKILPPSGAFQRHQAEKKTSKRTPVVAKSASTDKNSGEDLRNKGSEITKHSRPSVKQQIDKTKSKIKDQPKGKTASFEKDTSQEIGQQRSGKIEEEKILERNVIIDISKNDSFSEFSNDQVENMPQFDSIESFQIPIKLDRADISNLHSNQERLKAQKEEDNHASTIEERKTGRKSKLALSNTIVLNKVPCKASTNTNGRKTVISVKKDDQLHSIQAKKADSIEFLSKLTPNDCKLEVKPEENHKIVTKRYMTISGQKCKLSIYSTDLFNSVLIKAKRLRDGLIMNYSENSLHTSSKECLILHIKKSILEYLCIESDKLVINGHREELQERIIAKGTNYIHKDLFIIFVYYLLERSEILFEVTDSDLYLKRVYSIKNVLSILGISKEALFEDPSLLILAVTIENSSLKLQYHPVFNNSHDYLVSKSFENKKCIINMYRFIDNEEKFMFITANRMKKNIIQPLKFTENYLESFFSRKIDCQIYYNIAVSLMLIEDKLGLSIKKFTENENLKVDLPRITEAATVIQLAVRAQRKKDEIKLKSMRQKKQKERTLILKRVKKIGKHYYYIFMYETNNNIFFECSPQGSPIVYSKYVSDIECIDDEYFDPSLIIDRLTEQDDKLVIFNSYSNSYTYFEVFTSQNHFFTKIDMKFQKVIHGKEYSIEIQKNADMLIMISLKRVNANKQFIKTFSIEDIQNCVENFSIEKLVNNITIKNNEIILSTMMRDISRSPLKIYKQQCKTALISTSKIQLPNIYLVTMNILRQNPNQFSDEDILVFEATLGASQKVFKELEIFLKEACAFSGFSKEQVIPMGHFIIKHMLVIGLSSIEIDFSAPRIDFNKFAAKIQRGFRKFRLRKAIQVAYEDSKKLKYPPHKQYTNFIFAKKKQRFGPVLQPEEKVFEFRFQNKQIANSQSISDDGDYKNLPVSLVSSKYSHAEDSSCDL